MNSSEMDLYYHQLLSALLEVDRLQFRETIARLLHEFSPLEMVDRYIAPILQEIGDQWVNGEVALSQVYMSCKFCDEVIPKMINEGIFQPKKSPPMAIVLLQDHHVLGKKIVCSAIRSAGYQITDYGTIKTPRIRRYRRPHFPRGQLLIS